MPHKHTFGTYLYLREDGTPYYVGKFSRKNRPFVKHFVPVPSDKERILVQEFPSEADALSAERFLISYYGRKDTCTGVLLNLTDGGEGTAGYIHSEEACRKIAESRRGCKMAPESRIKIGLANLGHKHSLEVCRRIGDTHRKTFCKFGHPLVSENRVRRKGVFGGCKACHANRERLRRTGVPRMNEMKSVHTSKFTEQEFTEFLRTHSVSGGCTSHKNVEAARVDQQAFTASMLSHATTVFGAADKVFNQMQSAYSGILAAGPSQHGYNAAQLGSENAAAITQGANAQRFLGASAKAGVAGFGGGNALNISGAGANAGGAQKAQVAGQTAAQLSKISSADWAQGNENWRTAGEGISKSAGTYAASGANSFAGSAQKGLNENEAYAKTADAATNAWQSEVSGAIQGGIQGMSKGPAGMVAGAAGGAIGGANPAGAQGPDFSGDGG